MTTWDDVSVRALTLPEVVVADHHGMAALRFRKNILATMPDEDTLRVMVSDEQIREAVAEFDWCTEVYWGAKLSAVAVSLTAADDDVVAELITDAWRRRAPNTMVRDFDAR
ncbi:MmcQ/YjbR family DNA-binding protein [Williamsia sp.]|uniref:MmcQ/YjbR family DNA-binding protein n=1 Tax=Williamsia sp. TaxID=1872085 RepID=UPI001A18535A|nr:MmcQ/YjbR family DNA-binding protein [Williamsia sp.]MBJ7291860.1 MmcQ/YjbR family DNA-binding protein [Williamsia sp.]